VHELGVHDVAGRPLRDEDAVAHRENPGRVAARLVEVVQDHHERAALLVEVCAEVQDLDLVGDVEEPRG
jgi:hypothetical protein